MGLPRRQIAVDQPQGGANYPFVSPSDQLELVLGDLHLTFRDDAGIYLRPLTVRWLYGFGTASPQPHDLESYPPPHERDLLIADASGQTVFDSREAEYSTRSWGDRLLLHEWLQSDNVLRIVQYNSRGVDDVEVNLPEFLAPTDGTLDDRACHRLPLQLRSLRVGLDLIRGTSAVFANGYNTTLEASALATQDGGRLATGVTIGAEAGSGEGRYDPGPPANIGIRRINGRKPQPNGNFLWDAKDCYRVERPILRVLQEDPREVEILDHALQCFSDCGPCCECQDFINVYEAIRRLRNRYAELVARAQAARDTYVKNRERFLQQRQCRVNDSLRIKVSPVCPNMLDIAIGYCNNTGECLHNLYLFLEFQHSEGDVVVASEGPEMHSSTQGRIVCGDTYRNGNVQGAAKVGSQFRTASAMERYDLGGQWPYYWAHFDAVDPGSLASVTTRMHFQDAATNWNIVAVADAYVVDRVYPTPPDQSPVPGVALGSGPTSILVGSERLVSSPVYAQSGLISGTDISACCATQDDVENYDQQYVDGVGNDGETSLSQCALDDFSETPPTVSPKSPGSLAIQTGYIHEIHDITVYPVARPTRTLTFSMGQGENRSLTACHGKYHIACVSYDSGDPGSSVTSEVEVTVPIGKYIVARFDFS